jgi:hypothetical protein
MTYLKNLWRSWLWRRELIARITETYGLTRYGGDVAELVRRYRLQKRYNPGRAAPLAPGGDIGCACESDHTPGGSVAPEPEKPVAATPRGGNDAGDSPWRYNPGRVISVNEQPVKVKGHTGAEIKAAAIAQGVHIQQNFVLQEELPNGKSRVVGDHDDVRLREGSRFTAILSDDNS